MNDIWIVCKKGLKELVGARGGRRGLVIQIVILAGIFGFLASSQKELWMQGIVPTIFFSMIPGFTTSGVVADSFAGERERKTLETLLASRLPDQAILVGKVMSVLIYALAFTILSMITTLVGINLAKGTDGIYLYPLAVFLLGLAGSILTGLLVASAGVFVSLRSGSVREAQQMLAIPMWLLFIVIGVGLPALTRTLPESAHQLVLDWLVMINPLLIGVALLLGIALLDMGLLALGVRRFHRTRLILD